MIGFIGLGVMGEPMCRNMASKSGEQLLGYDIDPAPLAGAPEVKTVCDQMVHIPAGSCIIDLSTTTVALAREPHQRFAERGVDFADAPVARIREAAQKGTLQ